MRVKSQRIMKMKLDQARVVESSFKFWPREASETEWRRVGERGAPGMKMWEAKK